jgi:autotransporter-associated beta strand protein
MNKNPTLCLVAALLLVACGSAPALAQQSVNPLAVPIVFDNQTGLDPSQIFIQFMGGDIVSGHYIDTLTGNRAYLSGQPNNSYSLAQIQGLGSFNATTNAKGVTAQFANTPGILVDNLPSGRVYLNFGTSGLINPGSQLGYTPPSFLQSDPNYNTRWQYIEATVKNGQVWADLSYIDFTSISFNLTANATGAGNANQISRPAYYLANATLSSAISANASLPVPSLLPPQQQFTRIISPQYTVGSNNQTVYGDFSSYLDSLHGKNSTISGFFAGVGGQLGQPNTAAQIYEYTASFSGNVTTNGTVTLTASQKSGTTFGNYTNGSVVPVPAGNSLTGVGNNTITLKYSDLIAATGIYGSNPPYQVSGTFTQNNTGIVNDVFGRVVGDLLAGLTFGTVGSTVNATLTIGNGTTTPLNGPIGSLSSSVWWGAGEGKDVQYVPVNGTIYTVGWSQSLAGSSNGTLLYGGAQPDSTGTTNGNPRYNYYSAALVGGNFNLHNALTPGYGTPFGDRIGNNLLTFTANTTEPAFMVLTINSDTDTPIPASVWTGGNGSWDTVSNWRSNNGTAATQIPAGNSTIQFLGTLGNSITATVDAEGNRTAAAISFRYGAQPFVLQNGTITLNGFTQNVTGLGNVTSVGANIVNSSSYAQTIQNDLTFTTNGTLAAVSANLTLSGNIDTSGLLTNAGGNTTLLSGNVSGTGGFSQTGTGTLAFAGSGNTFTGGVAVSSGTLALGSNGAAGSGDITFSGGTLAAQGGSNYTFSNNLFLNGNATVTGQGSLAFNGNTTFSNSTTFTANAPIALNGPLVVTGSNSVNYTFTVAGNSSLTLGGSSASTYNGSFAVNSGTLELAKTGNATSVFNNLTIGGAGSPATVLVSTANQIDLQVYSYTSNNSTVYTSPAITLNPGATLALGSNSLNLSTSTANTSASLVFYGGNATGNGTISTFGNTATIQFLGTGNSSAAIANNISLQNSTLSGNFAGNFTAFNVGSNNAPVQLTITGGLSGPGGLSKGEAGTLWLQGNNTYTGGTTLAGGVLAASSLGNGLVSFTGGGLSPGGLSQTGNLTVNGISFNKGFILSTLAANNTSDFLRNTGNFSNQKGNKIRFVFESGSTPVGNFTYTLASNFDPTAGNYTYTSANIPGLVGNFSYTSGNLVFSGAAGVNATWTGNTSGSWATDANWQSNAVPASGADILFGNATNRSVDTAANQTTGSITFLAGAQSYTVSNNTITLGGDLTNNSASTQTVSSNLTINWDRSFNAASGNLALTNIDLGTENRVNTAIFNAAANRTIAISGNLTDDYIVSASEALPAGNIVKTGAGTLLITRNGGLKHHGTTTIEQGVLAAAGTIGDLTKTTITPTLVFSGGTLRATGNITTSYNNAYRQAIDLEETGIFDTNGYTITLDSGITGPGGITKTGAGILVFTANATPSSLPASMAQTNYQGMLAVNQGQVWMSNNQNLGANTTTSITGNGSLVLNNFISTVGNDFILSGAGDTLNNSTIGALSISGANTNFTGNITLLGDTIITSGANISTSFSGNVLTGNSNLGLNILSSGTLSLSGSVTGTGGLTKNGSGTLTLSGTNTYTGTTTLNAGTTTLTSPANIPATAGGDWTIGNNATLTLAVLVSGSQSPFNLKNNLFLSGNGSAASGTADGAIYNTMGFNNISGNTSLTGNAWVNISSGGLTLAGPVNIGSYTLQITTPTGLGYIPATISGNLSGNGTIQIGQSGAAAQIALSGNNAGFIGTFAFAPGVQGSSITASASNALGTANQTITPGNTLALQGGITLNNTISINGTGSSNPSLLNNFGENTISNVNLVGTQAYVVSNAGTLRLGGTLGTNNSTTLFIGSGSSTGTIATLGSNMTVGSVQLASGFFSPGGNGNYQNLTVNGSWSQGNSNSTLVVDLGGGNQSDTLTMPYAAGGSFAFGNATSVFLNDNFGDEGFVQDQSYKIFASKGQSPAPTTTRTNIQGLSGNWSQQTNTGNLSYLSYNATAPTGAIWTGNQTGEWNTGSNWLSGSQPAAGAAITFAGNKTPLVDTVGNHSTGTISFAPGAGNFTISNNTLTVGGRITNNSGVTQTITSNLTYLGSGKSILAQSGDLVLGNIAMAPITPQNLSLIFNGSSNTTVTGSITQNQNGTASIVKNGNGTLTLSGNSTYTGATTVDSGTLLVTGALGSTPVTISSAAALGGGGSIGGNISFAAGSNFVFSNSSLRLTGPETTLSFGNFSVSNVLGLPSASGNQTFALFTSNTPLNTPNAYISTANLQNLGVANKYTLSDGRFAYFGGTNATAGVDKLESLFLYITSGSTPPDPSSLYWVGSNGTSWLAADNWSATANATLGNTSLAANGTQSVTFASTGANATTTAASLLNSNATINGLTFTTSEPVSIGGTGILTISGNLATAVAVESTAGNVSITAPLVLAGNATTISVNGTSPTVTIDTIGGSNGLVKSGSGTVTLNGTSTYTGGTTISGGTLAISSSSITGNITNNATLAFNQTANGTFSGNISGTGSVTKSGNATLTLNGTNTHSGNTTINSGTLVSGNLVNSTLVLEKGAAFSPGAVNTIDTISVGGITLNGGDLLYNLGNGANDRINASGTAALNGHVVFDFSNLGYAAGNFTVLTGNGVSTFNTANLSHNAVGNFTVSGNFVVSGNNLVFQTVAPPPGTNYTWTGGAGNGNWTDSTNWVNQPVPGSIVHFAGANQTAVDTVTNQSVGGVVFNTGASQFIISNNTITLAGNIENDSTNTQTINSTITLAKNALFAADSGDLAFGGAISFGSNSTFLTIGGGNSTAITGNISGNGSLLKRGTGNLALSGINTFTGNTSINGGNLIVQGGSTLSDTGTVTLNSANATFTIAASETIGSLQGGGATAIAAAQTLTIAEFGNATYSGAITGTGTLAKTVNGTLTLAGNNSYTGGTTVSAGTLATQGNERISDSSSLSVASGAAFQLGGNETLGSIAGEGAINLQSNTLTAGGDNSSTTFSGNIAGGGAFAKAGTGNLTLSGNNTYAGPTTVTAGTLVVTGTLGSTPVTIGNAVTLGGNGTLGGNLTLAAGSNLVFNPASSLAVNGSSVSFGNFSLSNLTGFNGSSSAPGNFTVLGGSAVLNAANLQNLGIANSQTLGGNEVYFYTGVGGSTLNLAVLAAVSNIYWVGSNGTDWFAANNWSNNSSATVGDATFGPSTGDIHFASSGVNATTLANINLSQNATVRNFIVSTNQTVGVGGNGTLTLNGSAGTGMHLTSTAGNVTFTVPIVVSGGSDIQIDGGTLEVASLNGTAVHIGTAAGTSFSYNASSNLTFDGTITGAGAFAKRGNGTLTLTGNNTYTGGTTISAGTLAGNSDSLQGNIANTAALVFNQSANGTYSGILSGSGSLTKNGAATLTLAGGNANSGTTLVNSGTLATQGDERLGNSSALTVASGALFQLGGNETLGSIAGAGAIDLQSNRLTAGGDNTSAAFSGNITGAGSLTKSGTGTLSLNGTNSLGSGLSIRGGTLAITSGTTTANGVVSVDNLTSANATLSLGGSAVLNLAGASSVTIGEGLGDSGVLLVSGNATLLIGSNMSVGSNQATGSATQTGGNITAPALALGGSNGGTGSYTLGAGNLSLGNLTLASTGSSFTFNGGTLLATANFTATAPNGGTTSINSGGGTINTGAFHVNWQPTLSGNGSLTKQGTGTLTILGNNTRTGTTVISEGTLAFNSATTQALSGTISGAGALRQSGSGSVVLSGNNTYTGGTTLASGSIQGLHANALGNGALTLSSGTLVLGNATNRISLTGITDLAWSSSNAIVSLANGGNITASGNFTNGGNAGDRTFDLGSGKYLQLGNNTLVSFGNTTFSAANFLASFSANHSHNGSFQIVGNSLVYTLTNGTATGNIIDNWAGPDTPTWVDFSVNGANGTVYSEVPIGRSENTIAGLIFSNSGNLVIQQNTTLNVTGGVLNVVNGTSLVTGGALATPGNFNKTGAGELDVQNAVIVGGTASIDDGLLSVNGQLNANTVVVNTGGTLGGNGTIVAPGGMTIAGTLSPGNSPGVISIVSNPVWASTATTLLEIASPSNYDRIVVSGTAQLAGALNIVNFGGNDSLAYGQQYPFLTATGGINGDFDTITAPATFRGRFLNQGTTGTIVIAPDTYTRVATTSNQRRIAQALDSFILAKSGDRETVSIALDLQIASQYPAAFDQIAPGFYESLPDLVIEQAYNQTQLLNQRMSSVRFGAQGFQYVGIPEQPIKNDRDGKSTAAPKSLSPIIEAPGLTNWNSWVMATGEFSNARGTSAPNYRNSAGGFLVGADYRLSENFSSGLFAGYQFNYAKYNGGGSNLGNSALFGLYGTYKNEDGFYADTVIGGGYTGFQTRRPIKFSTINRTARANPGTGQFNAGINLGKDWTIDKFIVGPLLGLQYTYAGTSAFTEQGADSLDLAIGSQNTSSLRSSLGGRVAYLWDVTKRVTLIPEVRAQWMHEFLNNAATISSSLDGGSGPSFGYGTSGPYRNSIFGGVGMSTKFGERWTASLFYNINFGNIDFTNNIISADLNLSF